MAQRIGVQLNPIQAPPPPVPVPLHRSSDVEIEEKYNGSLPALPSTVDRKDLEDLKELKAPPKLLPIASTDYNHPAELVMPSSPSTIQSPSSPSTVLNTPSTAQSQSSPSTTLNASQTGSSIDGSKPPFRSRLVKSCFFYYTSHLFNASFYNDYLYWLSFF